MRTALLLICLLVRVPAAAALWQEGSPEAAPEAPVQPEASVQEEAPVAEPAATLPEGEPDGEEEEPGTEDSLERPTTPEAWVAYVEELAERIQAGEAQPEQADALYEEFEGILHEALDANRGAFRGARLASDPIPPQAGESGEDALLMGATVAELYESLEALYQTRMHLFALVTPEFRARLEGNGIVGVRQFWLEVDFVQRTIRYQRIAIPAGLRQAGEKLRRAPVPTILGGMVGLAALILFRLWRKWAGAGIPKLREFTRRAWRHHAAAKPFGEFLRYVERTRRPIEWIGLFLVLFKLLDVPEVHQLEGVLRISVFWSLLAWLSVNLADAFASREGTKRRKDRSKARLRTLRILAVWGLVLGAGLRLTQHLAGRGTLHAWTWHLFEFLAVPVAMLLFLVLRPSVRKRLEREARFSPWVARLMKRRGFFDVVPMVGGLAYLAMVATRRAALKVVRRSAVGRTLVAEALRQSMTRAGEEGGEDVAPVELDADLRKSWLRSEAIVESAVADELKQVLGMLDRGWKSVVVVGERGAGKSFFLRRLVQEIEGNVLVVSCPHGGADQAYAAFCRALELDEQAPTPETVHAALKAQAVRMIAWDDIQRICRPVLGGQAELDRLLELFQLWQDLPTVATVDSAAWEYMGPMREGTISGASSVALSAWTEIQIGELLEVRAREVGMELDYGGLHFPRLLLERDFDSPEQGLRASYRRILWAEADGNPEVALRLIVDHIVEKEDGDGRLRLPRSPAPGELEGMSLVALLVLRFIVQTDGATAEDVVAGLRYPEAVVENAMSAAAMRGMLEENHGRYRVSWKWYRTITRVLARRNMLGAARQKAEPTRTTTPRKPPARRRLPR